LHVRLEAFGWTHKHTLKLKKLLVSTEKLRQKERRRKMRADCVKGTLPRISNSDRHLIENQNINSSGPHNYVRSEADRECNT
jgi:hypothetical protein